MSAVQVEQRVCDRPGCGRRVTERGMLGAALSTAGVSGIGSGLYTDVGQAPDLCRECVESLGTWWTARQRAEDRREAGNTSG